METSLLLQSRDGNESAAGLPQGRGQAAPTEAVRESNKAGRRVQLWSRLCEGMSRGEEREANCHYHGRHEQIRGGGRGGPHIGHKVELEGKAAPPDREAI